MTAERDKQQRTLFSLKKVVRLESSAVTFSEEDISSFAVYLSNPGSSKQRLLNTLRKLDCLRLELGDLQKSNIGGAVATLTQHPKSDVSKLAAALLDKWRAMVDGVLFKKAAYDAAVAMMAPEVLPEDAPPPPPPPAPPPPLEEAVAAHKRDQERRRRDEEDALGSSASDNDGIESCSDSDPDWRPGGLRKKQRSARKTPVAAA